MPPPTIYTYDNNTQFAAWHEQINVDFSGLESDGVLLNSMDTFEMKNDWISMTVFGNFEKELRAIVDRQPTSTMSTYSVDLFLIRRKPLYKFYLALLVLSC